MNNPIKKSKTILLVFFSILLVVFLTGEIGLRLKGFKMMRLTTQPRSLLTADSVSGWKLTEGTYTICFNDSNSFFVATVNQKGDRITSMNAQSYDTGKVTTIQIYGCSCTFGFSVPDSSTQSFILQSKLPNCRIQNKGVPGYGLAQMFLHLQQVVSSGDTPQVAVFNYANFQERRTALSTEWGSVISLLVEAEPSDKKGANKSGRLTLPYYDIKQDSLWLHYSDFSELEHLCPLVNYSSLLLLSNIQYVQYKDQEKTNAFHETATKTAFEIMKYCKSHRITPIFASLTESEDSSQIDDISLKLKQSGYLTLNYGITFDDNRYNKPLSRDKSHPNSTAHAVYADKLYAYLMEKKLILK